MKSLGRVRLFATTWTVAYQAPPSMGFFRQEYWSGLPFPSPGDLPNPGIKPGSPTLQADTLQSEPPGKTPWRRAWQPKNKIFIQSQNTFLQINYKRKGYFTVKKLCNTMLHIFRFYTYIHTHTHTHTHKGASLVAQMVNNPPAMQEAWVQSLGQEDPLEKGMTTHSSILAWRIPWTEEPGGLQSTGSQRVGHN